MSELEIIQQQFRQLRMPTAVQGVEETLAMAIQEDWSLEGFVHEILAHELVCCSEKPSKSWRNCDNKKRQ